MGPLPMEPIIVFSISGAISLLKSSISASERVATFISFFVLPISETIFF